MLQPHLGWILASLGLIGVSLAAPNLTTERLTQGESTSRPTKSEVRKLKLVASDQQAVPGWLIEARPEDAKQENANWRQTTDAVVLLHMFRSDHTAWEPILDNFQKRGITTLAIDMRGHGENVTGPNKEDLGAKVRGRDADTFRAMHRDAFAAVDWLIEQGYRPERIGLLGASVGCSVAIDSAVRRKGLGPVGVLTPGLNYLGVNSEEHIASWETRDLLIVTSEEESTGGPAPLHAALQVQFKARQKKSDKAEDHVTYWVLEQESIHGTRMFGVVEGIEARITTWFAERFEAGQTSESSKSVPEAK